MTENPESLALSIKRKMFEMGMPTGSERPDLQAMGAPPLHLCDPDIDCPHPDHSTPENTASSKDDS